MTNHQQGVNLRFAFRNRIIHREQRHYKVFVQNFNYHLNTLPENMQVARMQDSSIDCLCPMSDNNGSGSSGMPPSTLLEGGNQDVQRGEGTTIEPASLVSHGNKMSTQIFQNQNGERASESKHDMDSPLVSFASSTGQNRPVLFDLLVKVGWNYPNLAGSETSFLRWLATCFVTFCAQVHGVKKLFEGLCTFLPW